MATLVKLSIIMLTLLCMLVLPSHLLAVDVPLYIEKYDFTKGANRPLLTSGWSESEETQTWSDGDSAIITFTLNPPPVIDFELTLDSPAFLSGSHLRQDVDISVYCNAAGTLVYTPEANDNKTFKLSKAWAPDGNVRLLLNFKNPTAPSAVGLNTDSRRLGISLKTLYVSTPNIEKTFQGVVTLGDCCFPKMQVDRYIEERFPGKLRTYSGGGNFFDYVVPTNIELLAAAISNRLIDCGTQECRVFECGNSRLFHPVDMKYNINFVHWFDDHPIVHGRPYLTQDLFDKNFESLIPKLTYLKRKFITNRKRTLYIHSGIMGTDPVSYKETNITKLRDAIALMREDTNFSLLILYNTNDNFVDRENIIFRKFTIYSHTAKPVLEVQKSLDEFNFLPCPIPPEKRYFFQFNYEDYLTKYPDLQSAFGGIKNLNQLKLRAWHHYIKNGIYEGRHPSANTPPFIADRYLALHPDLQTAFGGILDPKSRIKASIEHFLNYGIKEGRHY